MISVRSSTVGKLPEAEPNLPQTIIFLVCEELGASALAVLTPDRRHPLPMARQLIAWVLCQWEGWTLRSAAQVLGVSDSTVGYYLRNVERRRRNGEWATVCKRLLQLCMRTV